MANNLFNISKAQIAYYAGLPAANDAIKVLVLQTNGLGDSIIDCDTIAAVLAGATEQTTMGRKTMTGVTVTVDDTNNWVSIDCADYGWLGASGSPTVGLVYYYDPDTTASSDSNNIPLSVHDFFTSPSGGDINVQVQNFARVT